MFENHLKSRIQHCIASEASYVYILSGQKFTKNAKNGQVWRVFENLKTCGQTVLPDRSLLMVQKLLENTNNTKMQMRHFE